jgi:hypothetical protein
MAKSAYENLCTQAYFQIESMCMAMRQFARSRSADELPHLVQSLAIRIEELNGALMHSVGGEDADNVENLRQAVYGSNVNLEVDHVA